MSPVAVLSVAFNPAGTEAADRRQRRHRADLEAGRAHAAADARQPRRADLPRGVQPRRSRGRDGGRGRRDPHLGCPERQAARPDRRPSRSAVQRSIQPRRRRGSHRERGRRRRDLVHQASPAPPDVERIATRRVTRGLLPRSARAIFHASFVSRRQTRARQPHDAFDRAGLVYAESECHKKGKGHARH